MATSLQWLEDDTFSGSIMLQKWAIVGVMNHLGTHVSTNCILYNLFKHLTFLLRLPLQHTQPLLRLPLLLLLAITRVTFPGWSVIMGPLNKCLPPCYPSAPLTHICRWAPDDTPSVRTDSSGKPETVFAFLVMIAHHSRSCKIYFN